MNKKNKMRKPKQKPLHKHDCKRCIYLGSEEGIDCYYCHDEEPCLATLIARYSSDGANYSSGTAFVMSSIGLNIALRLGYEKKVLPQRFIDYVRRRQAEWFNYCKGDKEYEAGINERWQGRTRFVIPDVATQF